MNTAPASEFIPDRPLPPAERAIQDREQSADPVGMLCNLTGGHAFCENYHTPHVPVLAAFGGDRLHVCRLNGSWDLDRAVSENGGALVRSIRKLRSKETVDQWDDLTFQFGPRSFLYADMNRIVGFATTPGEAERLVTQFSKAYSKPPELSGGSFHLIQQDQHNIGCAKVTLSSTTVLSDEALGLHYGAACVEWHQDFAGKLRSRNHGVSIFEGMPGTGKTSYLRHLMGVLDESHRFYYIPTSTMGVLSKPEFTGFWADQRRAHANHKFVVVLEDSDTALMTRGSDNREQVSAILNLSDGFLADFLRLQIICTINCTAADIDQALLRPGRLLCHRIFDRLDYPEACRLAQNPGRRLPVVRDYSLAEVFAENRTEKIDRPRIGFAA